MTVLPVLPAAAFAKADPSPDPLFYAAPRLVAHIDDRAIAAVTDLYRRILPAGGRILDLMSSWISHLPAEIAYAEVTGLGMNAEELAANPRLSRRIVKDLNADPVLPFPDRGFDGAACCVSIQYLQNPVAVMLELNRVLEPGSPVVITFSDRCFPTKAVAIWQARGIDHAALVSRYLDQAGFPGAATRRILARDGAGDPLWAVVGRRPDEGAERPPRRLDAPPMPA